MLYYGERKIGCRCMEVIFHGLRTLIIENNLIRVILLVDKGCDIISYVHKRTDTDFLWTNPMGLSVLEKRRFGQMDTECDSDNYVGGLFEILPNLGGECEFKNKHFTANSEVAYLPWNVQILSDSADKMVFLFTVKFSKYPFILRKTLTIKENSTALVFEETLENLGQKSLPYLWGYHPCIGAPFLSEDCIFTLPTAEKIPMLPIGSFEESLKCYPCEKNGEASIKNQKTGLSLAFSWDSSVFTHCYLWICPGNTSGHHHHGGAYVAGIIPANSDTFTLAKAAENGHCDILSSGEIKKTWYKFEVL